LSQESSFRVLGTANNGKEAVEQTIALKPDIVLMDMTMADYDGLYGVEHIMKDQPTPILILSSLGNTNLHPIFDALRLGAVDYINKPKRGGSKIREMNEELIQCIKKVAHAKPKTINILEENRNDKEPLIRGDTKFDIIVIGASTGGPSAIEKIVVNLPKDLNIPVVVIQHMPENFIPSFASRLNYLSQLDVRVAQIGETLNPGVILIAPGNLNIILDKNSTTDYVISSTSEIFKEYNHPSINALMISAGKLCGEKCLGIILTGMGKDGGRGMKLIKERGGTTIAQDESSSIIFGMPIHAIALGVIDQVMAIGDIASGIVKIVKK
jgi:two-component system chemotaxis response regulator CheB